MAFVNVYSKVCRTCLMENCPTKSVFGLEEYVDEPALLSDVLMSCASVEVYKGDGLPEQICLSCAQEMNRAFLFRKLCEKSDATLRHDINTFHTLSVQEDSKYITLDEQSIFLQKEEDPVTEIKNDLDGLAKDSSLHSEDAESNQYNSDNLFGHVCDSDYEEDSNDNKNENKHVLEKSNVASKRKTYNCNICEEDCFGLGPYRRHMAIAHRQIFKCDICGKDFKSTALLSRHKLNHEPTAGDHPKKLINNKTKSYKNKTGIVKKRNLPRTCTICNKTFRFHSNLERHKLIHTGEKPYLCNVCGKGFAQLSYLKIHSFIHTGEKPYKCQLCDKSFAAPGTLMTHIRTHTGERPHVCKICGKDFPQSGYLSAHIRTHTGEKPVECKVCHRRFNQSGRLIIHMRIHSGEKPYPCKECGRSFAVKGTLKKHIRTHTGERPYICSICGQAFAQSGTLATHMKIHRPK